MKYIIHPNKAGITFFYKNTPFRFNQSDERYSEALSIFDLPKEEQDSALEQLICSPGPKTAKKEVEQKGFVIFGDIVSYQNEKLPDVLAKKVLTFIEQNLPIDLFLKFWENLRLNPSYSSITELYDFLAYKDLPLTEDGCFLAYKGVQSDFYSVKGNTDTQVLKGKVDSSGKIYNGVGEAIIVKRQDVCDDRSIDCAPGIHVGSLDYAKNWANTVVVVKVNPKDVVSVPKDHNCQKCRCSAYEVVAHYKEEILHPVVDEDFNPIVDEDLIKAQEENNARITAANALHDEVVSKVSLYIKRKKEANVDFVDFVTIRQIQNSFSPAYPSRERIMKALDLLGFTFFQEDGVYYVNIS